MTRMERLTRWLRLKQHALELRRARARLVLATGADFDRWRARVFELEHCVDPLDPEWCGCFDKKPMRKVVEG